MQTQKRPITSNGPLRMVAYVRVSTIEQGEQGVGLDAQRATIEHECQRRGWELVGVYQDVLSGKSVNGRHGLADALAAIEGGSASGLVVAKLDRLSRSLADFAALMERSRQRGWALVALDLGVDTTTPSGELLSSVVASVAQYERRLIGQRTKDALAVKRAQGVQLGRPRSLPTDTARRIQGMRRRGLTLAAIALRLNAEQVPTAAHGAQWHPTTVRRALVA